MICYYHVLIFFFFNDTAPPEIYPLPLHAALPISLMQKGDAPAALAEIEQEKNEIWRRIGLPMAYCALGRKDRKSTRLNSSHGYISYAVFCLKKKKQQPA